MSKTSVLGVILVARIVNGSQQATSAAGSVIAFASTLRTVAMLSCNVSETLTINAGADHEKKATTKFRYELVRLLNLSFYCYTLMLKGLKLVTPPASLIPLEGGVMEAEVLSVVSCPTAMVCKWITSLLEEQRQAARITDQQVSVMTTELIKLMKVYQDTHGLQFTPMPAMLNGFSYFFVVVWVYSMAPVIAMMEMHDNGDLNNEGFGLGLAFSFFLALFYFGLYEAGKIIEQPLAGVVDLLPIDEMGHTLSDDLSNLVDDPNDEVPVFLPRPPDARNGKI
ncbi:hypothetical protein EMIHUDRAFT_444211 [Emiliania huxleyi CCMP1516]|uniref:Uncharacterized protein n=2 Tax=Emiliania huxleyi TaxID=2903 RepID=A0A0D3JIB3_EMIH1|nr:hypothetical protein EMIHUDRAFT_444211 [Emiliania huxleyi CCMP1516]EOD23248.1 hypothetical protein EMIHUDRAFT_444211 [Emiliania huxleyi CCMP1516]|eukprot:XP_005775677.1 hypothetical protein EMIHUDRAFT_444211 [Emiliania huxleyi CCMP1516]